MDHALSPSKAAATDGCGVDGRAVHPATDGEIVRAQDTPCSFAGLSTPWRDGS